MVKNGVVVVVRSLVKYGVEVDVLSVIKVGVVEVVGIKDMVVVFGDVVGMKDDEDAGDAVGFEVGDVDVSARRAAIVALGGRLLVVA